MDTDLFQAVLLALLAVGLVVLIALLATLGGIRKALERPAASDRAAPPPAQAAGTEAPSGGPEVEPEVQQPEVQQPEVQQPEVQQPEVQQPEVQQPAAESVTPAASGAPGQADTIRSVLQQHGISGSSEAAGAASTAEPVADSVFATHADDPQEEPFQRDGRWWFRRGDELLLYNEGTGQWEPAPDSSAGTAAPAVAAPPQAEPVSGAEATVTSDMPAVADQVATFWKCPTCGAVNGSTAGSCRMCFAARP